MVPEPILLVEILSPTNEIETWANIWAHTTIPTVMEILITSSTKIEAELLRRRDGGSWPETPARIAADTDLTLASFDYRVALKDVYKPRSSTAFRSAPRQQNAYVRHWYP
jgi:hypothetical protein